MTEQKKTEKKSAAKKSSAKQAATKKTARAKVAPRTIDTSTYAVIRTGGKQYTVHPGSRVRVEKLAGEPGSTIELSDVCLVKTGDAAAKVGNPLVAQAKVKATVLAHSKDKKVIIYKKRRRKGYTKKQGHRQTHTELMIDSISA